MIEHRCRTCGITKPIEQFSVAKQNKSGYNTVCKSCSAEYMRNYWIKNPQKYKQHKGYVAVNDQMYKNIYFSYGLSKEQFDQLYNKYNGLCWSCKESPINHIDHDHACCPTSKGRRKKCGKCIRGLLCGNCNTGLGLFKDDPKKLQAAIQYLETTGYVDIDSL